MCIIDCTLSFFHATSLRCLFLFFDGVPTNSNDMLHGNVILLNTNKYSFYFQGLWYEKDSSLWMLLCMSDDLLSFLNRNGVFAVQELLNLPSRKLRVLLQQITSSELYQVSPQPQMYAPHPPNNNSTHTRAHTTTNTHLFPFLNASSNLL